MLQCESMSVTHSLTFDTISVAATQALGQHIGDALQPGDVVLLQGPFGAGKTHLVKGIAAAWGIAPDEVNSPSFVLVNEYRATTRPLTIYHVDLYRITNTHDLLTVGLDDMLDDAGICLVEWAEQLDMLTPATYLLAQLAVTGETARRIELRSYGARYDQLLATIDPEERHAAGH